MRNPSRFLVCTEDRNSPPGQAGEARVHLSEDDEGQPISGDDQPQSHNSDKLKDSLKIKHQEHPIKDPGDDSDNNDTKYQSGENPSEDRDGQPRDHSQGKTTTPLRMSWATIAMPTMPSTRQTVLEPETTTAK